MYYKIVLLALLTISLASCKQKKTQSGGHNHGDVAMQLTAYSDSFEIFAEVEPLVAGHKSHLLVHVTHIPGFKAVQSAKVTASLNIGGEISIDASENPVRPGIWELEFTPVKAGKGHLTFFVRQENGETRIEAGTLEVYSNDHDAIHAAEEAEIHTDQAIRFSKEQSWKVEFSSEYPHFEDFGPVIKTSAMVESAQGEEVLLTARASGTVIFTQQNLLEGKQITRGKTLFNISGSGVAEQNTAVRYAEAKTNFETTEAEYQRLKLLAEQQIISQRELQQAKAAYENAKAVYENLNRNFSPSGHRVSSPLSGYLRQLYVRQGQYVEAGQALASIAQGNTLLLKAGVRQKYAPLLSGIQTGTIRSMQDQKSFSLEELNGKIVSVGQSTTDHNYLIPVTMEIENPGSFMPGSFVEIYLQAGSEAKVITVPNTSLIEEQGEFFVFVQLTPELFDKRSVKTGISNGIRTEIRSGLGVEERIVTKGAMNIKLAQASGQLDAHSGHAH